MQNYFVLYLNCEHHMQKKKYRCNSPFSLSVKRSKSGLGVFANEPIAKGEFVLEYTGETISAEEADKRGGPLFVNRELALDC
jgi:SET domain-containing protein